MACALKRIFVVSIIWLFFQFEDDLLSALVEVLDSDIHHFALPVSDDVAEKGLER